MAAILLNPIGLVHSPRTEAKDDLWGNVISVIELDGTRFTHDSVSGLSDFSHIMVVYHFHGVADESVLAGANHPRGNPDWPRVGIFAQRKKTGPTDLAFLFVSCSKWKG